jgi:hypothetical protein
VVHREDDLDIVQQMEAAANAADQLTQFDRVPTVENPSRQPLYNRETKVPVQGCLVEDNQDVLQAVDQADGLDPQVHEVEENVVIPSADEIVPENTRNLEDSDNAD